MTAVGYGLSASLASEWHRLGGVQVGFSRFRWLMETAVFSHIATLIAVVGMASGWKDDTERSSQQRAPLEIIIADHS